MIQFFVSDMIFLSFLEILSPIVQIAHSYLYTEYANKYCHVLCFLELKWLFIFLNHLREVEMFEVKKYPRFLEYILIVLATRPNNN